MNEPRGSFRADYTPTVRSESLPTVKVADGVGGFIIINTSDYDASMHTLFAEPASDARAAGPSGSKGKVTTSPRAVAAVVASEGDA